MFSLGLIGNKCGNNPLDPVGFLIVELLIEDFYPCIVFFLACFSEGADHVYGGGSLRMLSVGDSITGNIQVENIQITTASFVDETRGTPRATVADETGNN